MDDQRETLTRTATYSPATVNLERRTVEVVWTTGAKVLRSSWLDGPFYEELSTDPAHVRMGRLNNGAPFLLDHDNHNVAATPGVVESARLEPGRGVAVVRFAKAEDDPEADKLFRKIADGIVQNVSVGYRTHKLEKVEGGAEAVPTFRATDWEPYEISAVAMGADDGAGFRSADTTNEVQIITGPGFPRADNNRSSNMETQAVQAAALAAAERARVVGIRSAVKACRLGDDLAEKLVANGTTLEKARGLVLEIQATKAPGASGIEYGEDARDKWMRGATAGLLSRSGGDIVAKAKAMKAPGFANLDLDPGEFRGVTLVDLARASLERQGVETRGMDRMTLIGRAFTARGSGPYSGTSDFPVLLENFLGKILLGAYATTPDTWSRFAKTDTVPDFRASPRYRTGSFGTLDALSENGEFLNKSVPDGSKTSISVVTKGNRIAISRQLVINDDMNALTDLGAKLGRAARLSVEVDVYALLALNSGLGPTQTDAQPFFHSNRANVNGTGSAITVAGIDADRVVMAAQRDTSANEYLDIRPSILLVPSGLGGVARVINASAINPDANGKIQQPNYVQGLFSDIIDTPRLSGTRRYLFADPSVAPAIVVAFLEGQGEGPVLETQQGWNVDGTEMRVRFDYQAQMGDPKGALTNAGV